MNISCTKIIFLFFFLVASKSKAQDKINVFHENEFSLRHSLNKKYSANIQIGSRAYLYLNEDFLYRLRQLEIKHFSTLKLDLKHSIALGLMYRNRNAFEDSSNEIRTTQQFNIKSLFRTLRFGHRFRSEQRFYNNFTAFRLRYRLALDLPLQGLKLDTGETYFVFTNEGLLSNSKINKPEIEYRLSTCLGLLLLDDLNVEFGLELRLDKINISTKETLFFNTSVELKI